MVLLKGKLNIVKTFNNSMTYDFSRLSFVSFADIAATRGDKIIMTLMMQFEMTVIILHLVVNNAEQRSELSSANSRDL